MSSGKKKYKKPRTYAESEVKRAVKEAGDEAVKRILLICIAAASDMFNLDDNQLEQFMGTMQRYIEYQKDGLIDLAEYSKTIEKKTGISITLSRW